jgi:hypothetical protein
LILGLRGTLALRQGGGMDEMTLAVVGIDFANADGGNRRFEVALCVPGEAVSLRAEPRNRHDRHAVAVLSARGHQIGYLSAERAPWIGRRLAREEVRAVFQGVRGSAAFIRVAFGGLAPTLPAERPPAEEAPDWGA